MYFFYCSLTFVEMDRSWIRTSKPGDQIYTDGVNFFINFAVKNGRGREKLSCPCFKCHNLVHMRVDEILNHLSKWAFDKTYTNWIFHGEAKERTSMGTVMGGAGSSHQDQTTYEGDRFEDMLRVVEDTFIENLEALHSLLNDNETPLYPGCTEYTKLGGIMDLFNVKASYGVTDAGG